MALTTLIKLKTFLGLQATADEDSKLSAILGGVEDAARAYMARGRRQSGFTVWPESGSGTEYYSGTGNRDLVLRHSPVTTVTSVYLDATGYFGDGTNAFASTTLLTAGTDYVLIKDDGSSGSAVGVIRRIGGIGGVSLSDEWHWQPREYGRGNTLTASRAPYWPTGTGNIKVTYTAGFTTIPDDIQLAIWQMVSYVRAGAKYGGQLPGSESLGEYSYSLMSGALTSGTAQLMDARRTLTTYRDLAV